MVPVVSVAVAAEHGVRCIEDEVVPLAMADEPEDDLIRDVYARFLGWGWVLYCVSSNYEAPPAFQRSRKMIWWAYRYASRRANSAAEITGTLL